MRISHLCSGKGGEGIVSGSQRVGVPGEGR